MGRLNDWVFGMAVKYYNLNLLIIAGPEGAYSVRLDSAAGEATVPFDLDSLLLSARTIRAVFDGLQGERIRSGAKEFGRRLFNQVFAEGARRIIEASYNAAKLSKDEARIRIRLQYANVPKAGQIPWELLYWDRPGVESFLATHPAFSIVRYLDVPEPARPTKVARLPLSVLGLIADPAGTLDSESEKRSLNRSFSIFKRGWPAALLPGFVRRQLTRRGYLGRGRPLVEAAFLTRGRLSELQDSLDRDDYHIFHFIGHSDEGRLWLDGDTEDSDSTEAVLGLLGAERHLSLAVLNSCDGAVASPSDAFAGIAQRLIKKSVPAVVGMQFPISDRAAVLFSKAFYQRLAEGRPIDEAMTGGRRALAASQNAEWATPVLYMRAKDGRIFDFGEEAGVDRSRRRQFLLTWAKRALTVLVTAFGLLNVFQYIPFLPAHKVVVVESRDARYGYLDNQIYEGLNLAFHQAEFSKYFQKRIEVRRLHFEEAADRLKCKDPWNWVGCAFQRYWTLAVFAPPSSTDARDFLNEMPIDFPRPIFLIGSNRGLTNPVRCGKKSLLPVRRVNLFRLTANDYAQARAIVTQIKREVQRLPETSPPREIAIVSDSSNQVYTLGLEALVKKELENCGNCPSVRWASTNREEDCPEESADATNVVSSEDLEEMASCCQILIYIGAPESARAFLYRIDRIKWKPDIKILSDSSVNRQFIEETELRPELLEGVLGVFPLAGDEAEGQGRSDLSEEQAKALRLGEPSFRLFAWDAAAHLMMHCLEELLPSDLPLIDRPTYTAPIRPDLLTILKRERGGFNRKTLSGVAGDYLFDSFGNNRRAAYYPWQITAVEDDGAPSEPTSPEGAPESSQTETTVATDEGSEAKFETDEEARPPELAADSDGRVQRTRYAWKPVIENPR